MNRMNNQSNRARNEMKDAVSSAWNEVKDLRTMCGTMLGSAAMCGTMLRMLQTTRGMK